MSIFIDLNDYFDLFTDANTYIPSFDVAPCPVPSPINKYVTVVIYVTVFLLNILGNSLVILVISSSKQKHWSTDIFLLNLALTDLLFAVTLPFWATYKFSEWVFGMSMCKIVSMLQEVNFYSGILFLACISVDRYLAVIHAIEFITKKKLWLKLVAFIIWIVSLVLSIPTIWSRDVFFMSVRGSVCHENLGPDTERWMINVRILHHLMGFFIPLLVMLFCYGSIIKTLCQKKNSQKQQEMKIILTVVFVFLICWLPYKITTIMDSLRRTGHVNNTCSLSDSLDTALHVTEILGFTHSCINPILYIFIARKFQQNFLTILDNKGIIRKDRWSS